MVVWAGRHRRDEWESLCDRYRQRIARFRTIDDVPVKASAAGPDKVRQQVDSESLIAAVPDPCWTVALDRRAKPISSRTLADRLARLHEEWPHPVAFLIGSDLGLSDTVLGGCRERLSLGPMTLPHELARLVLYEQIYRALSILGGIKYHREPL